MEAIVIVDDSAVVVKFISKPFVEPGRTTELARFWMDEDEIYEERGEFWGKLQRLTMS